MPARYYRRYRRRYPYRTYGRRYRYYSRSQRRASRNQTAARQQRDKAELNISVPTKIDTFNARLELNNGDDPETVLDTGVYALNVWDLLRKSEFYQSYANMYDQVKIEKATIKLTPYQYPIYTNVTGVGQYYNGYTVVTAWDRTGLSEEQTYLRITDTSQNAVIGSSDSNNTDGLYVRMSGKDVGTYSSAITRSVNPNSNTSLTRTIYPSSMAEKSYYVNTSDIDEWYDGFDSGRDRFYGIYNAHGIGGDFTTVVASVSPSVTTTTVPKYPLALIESKAVTKNPCYLVETPEVPFKPTLLVGLYNDALSISRPGTGDDPIVETLTPKMAFNVEADIVCSFRGLRKASIV